MESIAQLNQLRNDIDSINLNLYIIESNLNLIEMLNPIPDEILELLSNDELSKKVSEICSYVLEFKQILDSLNPKLRKAIYNQSCPSNEGEPYAGFKVDEKPMTGKELIETQEQPKEPILSFEVINQHQLEETGKPIKPVNRKTELPYKGECPHCGAPNDYIYDNNHKGQYLCKACKNTFQVNTSKYNEIGFYCPHCHSKLQVHHDRSGYIVYYCRNDDCSYYKDSLKRKEQGDKTLKTITKIDKLRYYYRSFKFKLDDVSKPKFELQTKIKLENIHHSEFILGTVLTAYINYGLSTRKTSRLIYDLFGVKISHQTIANYAEAAASLTQYLITNYKYDIGNIQTGDETYINVSGKKNYVFFFSDTIKKIITAWHIYPNRDTRNAVESILMALNKYNEIPENLLLITDGNPIYNAAQLFLSMNGIDFDLQQVIGVSNKDETSKKYRAFKQAEERLNRTYKQNYYGTNGYSNNRCANIYMTLYVTFFNFLRTHSSLGYKTPVELEELQECTLMPDKWIKLLNISQQYIN